MSGECIFNKNIRFLTNRIECELFRSSHYLLHETTYYRYTYLFSYTT